MKISVIITTILIAQVSASFFDVFQGAVLSVQNSFGKLLSDVVTDVKETVDCTILAVEHILSLSPDATTRYYDKCGSVNNKTDSVSEPRQDASAPKVEVTLNLPNNSEYLQKVMPAEIDARINETLSKVLGNYKPHDSVLSIENVLAKESEQLAGVSAIVKKKLDKVSHEVTNDLKKIVKQRDSEPSVDTILQEIKVLEKREQNTKNTSEAREIHLVINQVLGKLGAIEVTEDSENIKLEEILKDLENNSNNSFVALRQQFEQWREEESRHLNEIKSKIEEQRSDHSGSNNRHGSKHPQPVIFNIDKNKDDVEPIKNSQEISSDTTTQVKETLDNRTRSRTIGDNNDKSLLSVANETSSTQNRLNESETNVSVMINSFSLLSTTYTIQSTTENPLENETVHPFESPTAVGSSEPATLSTNQSTILQNNLTRNYTNQTVTNTNSASINESIPSVDLLADLDKRESTIVTANEPTTVTLSDPLQPPEITAIKDVILPVKRNTDSGKEESSDSAKNNNTVIISAAETVEAKTTLTSQSNNNSNDTVISSTTKMMVEKTPVNATSSENVESSTSATNELVTTLVKFDAIASNDTMLTSSLSSINFSTPVNVTILPTESSTATVNEESSTVTAKIISGNDNDSNNVMLPSTSSLNLESTPISETVQPEETSLASGKDKSKTDLYDAKISSTSLPTVENTPVSVTIQPEETGKTSDNEKSSTVTTKIVNDNDSNNTMITNDSSPIVENASVIGTVEPEETTTVSGNEEFLNASNETMITNTSLPIIECTLLNKTIQPNETTTTSSNKEFLTETTSELTTTSKIVNESDSDTTITSTPTSIISTSESETIQIIDLTKVSTSDEESLGSTANIPTRTLNTADDDDDDSSAAVVTMTPETISESIPQEHVTAAENYETLVSTTNLPIASPATLIYTDSNIDAVTSTAFPAAEITTVSEIIEPVESTTRIENVEPSVLSTARVTIPIIVTTRTVFPPTESIPTSESVTASRNEEDLKKSPTLKANDASRTQEILNSPDLNFMVRNPPLTITESPTINRQWLSPNTLNQLNYNKNGAPRNNYEFNAPISLSDRLPQTRQTLNNPEVPMYGQVAPPIIRSSFDGAPKLLTPEQRKIESEAVQQAAFEFFDSIDKRLSHSESPFGPEEDILKIANTPSTPLMTNAPRKPIDPQRKNYENPSYVPTPKHPTVPPYYFGDRAPANTYRPQGFTTHRPKNTAARANNYKSPSMDYDSFFHTPPRGSEAHQRALKEARQLIAKSKRSERIMNSIMKNKNKFNARSAFG